MKKIALLFIATLCFTACSIEDDGEELAYELSLVTETDLPEYFEKGKTYKITITYQLPTACHSSAGLEAKRGNTFGDQRRDIYVAGISIYDINEPECELEDEDLLREASFSILIDEDEAYTFYLWNGYDDNNESQYNLVEVPVLEQE